MSEIKKKINGIELMKWVVILSLFLAFLGGLGIPEILQGGSNVCAIESDQRISEKIPYSDLSSFGKFLEYLEIEEEEDDDNHQCLNTRSSQSLSLLLVPKKITSVFSFPPRQKVKLFILFHSWKSFLHI